MLATKASLACWHALWRGQQQGRLCSSGNAGSDVTAALHPVRAEAEYLASVPQVPGYASLSCQSGPAQAAAPQPQPQASQRRMITALTGDSVVVETQTPKHPTLSHSTAASGSRQSAPMVACAEQAPQLTPQAPALPPAPQPAITAAGPSQTPELGGVPMQGGLVDTSVPANNVAGSMASGSARSQGG